MVLLGAVETVFVEWTVVEVSKWGTFGAVDGAEGRRNWSLYVSV